MTVASRYGVVVVTAQLLAAGCATLGADVAAGPAAIPQGDGLYPQSFRMLHRVVLSVHGRELAFSGYVLVQRPSTARVVAFSEMGGTLFDVVLGPSDEVRVVKAAPGLNPSWLADGVGRVVRLLYLSGPAASSPGVFQIDVRAWRRLDGWGRDIPVSVLVKNLTRDYSVDVTVLRIEPAGEHGVGAAS